MIALVVAFGVLASFKTDLAAADKIFAGAYPMPVVDHPVGQLRDALEAYQDIADKYGEGDKIQRRIGACLIASGKYAEAAYQSPNGSPEKKLALNRFAMAKRFERFLKRHVVQVLPEPGRSRYLVLSGDHDDKTDDWGNGAETLSYIAFISAGNPTVLDTRPIESEYVDAGSLVYLAPLRHGGPNAVLLCHDQESDGDRSEITVFTTGAKLRKVARFFANEGAYVSPASKRHGLTIVIGASWKVYWEDAYEWSNGMFRFANARRADLLERSLPINHPVLYSGSKTRTFADWMVDAAHLDVEHRFTRAKRAWRKAERMCKSIGDSREDRIAQDYYGDAAANLKEIKQRIRWIDHHDYNHMLLYRPYDADVLVPPFKLGNARD